MRDKKNRPLEKELEIAIKKNGLSITAAAKEIGVNHGAVSRWLSGKTHIAFRHQKQVENFIDRASKVKKKVRIAYARCILNDESRMKCIIDYLSHPKNKYELIRLYKLAKAFDDDKSKS